MRGYEFNHDWTCRHLEEPGPGTPVTLPHDAMLAEPRTRDSAGGINTGWYAGRDYLYEKTFAFSPEWEGKTLLLEFEGVYHNAEVWLNGKQLAFRPYGYTNFYVDLTGRLDRQQPNCLQVIARNADQPNSRWYSGAGIYRPVTLWTAPAEYIPANGLKVRTLRLDPPTVEVRVETSGAGTVQVEILDGTTVLATGETTADGKVTLPLPGAEPWSPEHPRLYTCRAAFGADTAETTFGLRTLEWGRQGLLLNGQRVILRGGCIHHDNGILGACCYPDAEERKIRLLQKAGYNAIRSAHNPCSKALLDACDRLGMLVMDEYIDMWYIHKTEHDYVSYFPNWWKQDLKDMVDKDYNHPSVILYSTGNEVSETAQPRGIALTGELTEYLHSLDPGRPVSCGVNIFFNFLSSIGFGVYSDAKAKKEAERAEKKENARKKKAVGSEFFNNLAGLLGDEFMKRGATLPPCDWKTKDAFANMDVAGYNYGIYRYPHDLKKYPDRLILGSETFCKDAARFYDLAKKEPRIIGDFVWAGMDYLGEVGVGAWEYADYAPDFSHGPGWVTAGSGRLDLTGTPWGEMLYTRVAFELESTPRLAVWPVNHSGEKHSPSAWRMSNALESWSWAGCEGRTAEVEVYGRGARAELLLNGRPMGRKPLKNCIARFRLPYEPGTLEAVVYDEAGRETGRSALHTAAEPTRLQAVPEQPAVAPGRLAFIRLQYADESGTVKPLERGKLQVRVTGGRLLGLGSGCPYTTTGFLTDITDTYYGRALAVVQADGTGPVELTVTDGQLEGSCRVAVG